jgi:hypothetical protein
MLLLGTQSRYHALKRHNRFILYSAAESTRSSTSSTRFSTGCANLYLIEFIEVPLVAFQFFILRFTLAPQFFVVVVSQLQGPHNQDYLRWVERAKDGTFTNTNAYNSYLQLNNLSPIHAQHCGSGKKPQIFVSEIIHQIFRCLLKRLLFQCVVIHCGNFVCFTQHVRIFCTSQICNNFLSIQHGHVQRKKCARENR